MQVDSTVRTGITEDQLQGVLGRLVQCQCGIIMAKRVFDYHRCAAAETTARSARTVSIFIFPTAGDEAEPVALAQPLARRASGYFN